MLGKTFVSRGNHDNGTLSNWQSLWDFSTVANTVGATNYFAQTSDATYSFDYGNSHFVVIDLPGGGVNSMSAAQIAWLDTDLTAAEIRLGTNLKHEFLFWHGPVYTVTSKHGSEAPSSTLKTVLNAHPLISAGFFGHEHVSVYAHINSSRVSGITDDFEEFTMGRAGAPAYSVSKPVDFSVNIDAFATVDVSGNDFTVSIYGSSGSVAYTRTFTESGITPPLVSSPSSNQSSLPTDTDNTPLWGETARLNVTVTDDVGVASVTVNLSDIGGARDAVMMNIGGNVYSTVTNASASTPPKMYNLTVNAADTSGNSNTSVSIQLKVMKNGDCTGNDVVNIGDALRLANNVSHPGNPVYALSSPYVCEVTGNGVINIGDALRLANNVSHPGNPDYILK